MIAALIGRELVHNTGLRLYQASGRWLGMDTELWFGAYPHGAQMWRRK